MKSTYVAGLMAGFALGFLTNPAVAQSKSSRAADDAWSTPKDGSFQELANLRNLGIGLATSGFIVGGRWEVANGGIIEVDVVWRKGFNKHQRIEVGAVGRFAFTPDASLVGAGIPVRGILRMHDRLDMNFELVLSYTRIIFNAPLFPESNGFIPSLRWGIGYYVDPRVAIGVNPVAFSVVTGQRVDPFLTYEPGVFVRFSPL